MSFIMAAFVAGQHPTKGSLHLQNAQELRGEAERIYAFTRDTTQLDLHHKPGPQLALLIQAIFRVEAVALFDADLNEIYRSGEWSADPEDLVRNVYFFETAHDDPEIGLSRRVLRMGNLPIGALILRGELSELTSNAIAAVTAITFDRYHALANESRIEAARQAEQLRTTVLDNLAHAYKTPLTAIRAASSGLSEMGSLTPSQAGMVALIEEQSELLSKLTNQLLKTARLEAEELVIFRESVSVALLIEDVVASVREQLSDISVQVAVESDDLPIWGDRGLLVALLTQYLDNAAKFAAAGTTVRIEAAEHHDGILVSVHNFGPTIPAADCEHVFERYFHSSNHGNRAATGIGLSVAKRAAEAHGGRVWVTSEPDHGTTFFALLPTAPQEILNS